MSAPQRVPEHPSNDLNDGPGPADPLGRLLAIEGSDRWPERRRAYQSCLREMAALLRRQDERARALIYNWLREQLGGLLMCRDDTERRAREEALADIALEDDIPAALELAATRVGRRRPHLLSFLRAKLLWRANDKLESLHRRHARRLEIVPDPMLLHSELNVASPHEAADRRLLVNQIVDGFEMTDVEWRALGHIAQGDSVAETARRTGRSRQQIYRLLKRAREWCLAELEAGQ